MPDRQHLKIALVGNPNTGKSSLFNFLTGLDQRVGNFPGITVERKVGHVNLGDGRVADLIDLPGSYSLEPRSEDERVTARVITDRSDSDHPDLVVLVTDATHLRTGLYVVLQTLRTGVPCILALNKTDKLSDSARPNTTQMAQLLGIPVVLTDARHGTGIEALLTTIRNHGLAAPQPKLKLDGELHVSIRSLINEALPSSVNQEQPSLTTRIDNVLAHPVAGYLIFLILLFAIFQSVFSWAEWPMELIEQGFAVGTEKLRQLLPPSFLSGFLIDGLWSGLAGVFVFVPQIAFLFLFISIMEETGYMARVSFLMDRLLRAFGLNGRSVVSLLGGAACAVPAIMSARTIPNPRERLITILVTPLMSCSARLPVYAVLIALVIPDGRALGLISYKGAVMFGLYALGTMAALGSALVLNRLVRHNGVQTPFIMEMPSYAMPHWRNVALNTWSKLTSFVVNAGKWIVAISVVLWLGSSFSWPGTFDTIERQVQLQIENGTLTPGQAEGRLAALKLESSFVGMVGKSIEPVLLPLGYDWRIGIAIVTSFAAREVFVGTMGTIFSLGDQGSEGTIREQMAAQRKPDGSPLYNLPFGLSLMVFYAFAMQCISTLAVTRSETGSWKWPALQFVYMGLLAYGGAMLTFKLASAIFA